MVDFMDSRFYTRWILIGNLCWIILSFLHVGVNCQPKFEVNGSGMINSLVAFTCITDNKDQFYAVFLKDTVQIALAPQNMQRDVIYYSNFSNRVTVYREDSQNIYNYTMVLDKLQCSDEGNYSCRINVNTKNQESVASLLVKTMPLKPTLTAATNDVVLGDTVDFECTANVGKPPQNLSLCVKQGQDFNCSETSSIVDLGNCSYSRTIKMTVNITEDTREAYCSIPQGQNLKDTQDWEVFYPILDIKLNPGDSVIALTEGETLAITCEARGKPQPMFSWNFQSKNGNLETDIGTKNEFSLANVGLAKSGVYTCIASNVIRNVTHNMTKSITVNIIPTTTAPVITTIPTTPEKTSSGTNGNDTKVRPQTNEKNDDLKLILGTVGAILFLIILIILLVILYRRRSKPIEIEEPPEKPRNNHEVNMKETKPDLVYSTGIEKGKLPMYNTGFDHNGEDDLYYAELAFDDKPRSRKPVVPLYDNSSNSDPYTTVMPHV